MLGISYSTARKIAPQLPGAVRLGQRISYRESAIMDFLNAGGCAPPSQPTA